MHFFQGFELDPAANNCVDADECVTLCVNGTCANERGGFSCSCPSGFRLRADEADCEDVDECAEAERMEDSGVRPCGGRARSGLYLIFFITLDI